MAIGKDTLNKYIEEADEVFGQVRRVYNGMSLQDDMYTRTNKLFDRCKELLQYLYDGANTEDTVVVSSKLQALKRSVDLWKRKLPEDYVEPEVSIEQAIVSVEGSNKSDGLQCIVAAQQSIRNGITKLCSGHPVIKHLQEMKRLEAVSKDLNDIMKDIIKLEL